MSTALHEVRVARDPLDGVWTGVNEKLGLFLEAESFEALMKEAWLVAPELAELGGALAPGTELRLKFSLESVAADLEAL